MTQIATQSWIKTLSGSSGGTNQCATKLWITNNASNISIAGTYSNTKLVKRNDCSKISTNWTTVYRRSGIASTDAKTLTLPSIDFTGDVRINVIFKCLNPNSTNWNGPVLAFTGNTNQILWYILATNNPAEIGVGSPSAGMIGVPKNLAQVDVDTFFIRLEKISDVINVYYDNTQYTSMPVPEIQTLELMGLGTINGTLNYGDMSIVEILILIK